MDNDERTNDEWVDDKRSDERDAEEVADAKERLKRLRIESVGAQRLRDFGQLLIGAMVAILFTIWAVFGSQTVSQQNQAILRGNQQELEVHAEATAARQCAVARELEYLATHPAKVNGTRYLTTRPAYQLAALHRLEEEACKITLIPIPGPQASGGTP